ncbi:late embryogenesis abundant protein Lea5-D [Elaeis guineensis]|uniref:Late embryogenesis abundant protein Lea5-D n=1 Tax=Elaeis guineensis var. tenera TaxID=51953 RepID=A0A6I9RSD0_ELAGV|nr:late embryogenesis abundant protein Lea5-D [Elaeis guineensis]
MARALSGATTLAAALSDGIAVYISRRGYAAVTGTVVSRGRSSAEEKAVRKATVSSGSSSGSSSDSWVPDPVTGYYRPGNRRADVDAAELREILLSHRSRQ